jgi:hypothetical protein
MKPFLFLIFLVFLIFNVTGQQLVSGKNVSKHQKLTKADTVKGWFRFPERSHCISTWPSFAFAKDSDDISYMPGVQLGYEFFIKKRFSVGVLNSYSYAFNSRVNDFNMNRLSIYSRYYFFGKNKNFIFPMVEYAMQSVWGYSNIQYPSANFQGVLPDGKHYNRTSHFFGAGLGVGRNIYNNMSINFSFLMNSYIGGNYSKRGYGIYLNLSYYIRKDQLPRKRLNMKK